MVLAPPVPHSRLSDKIQFPDDSDGDSDVSVHLSPGGSPHPSFVQQALYGLELAQISAASVAAGAEFPAAPEEPSQILLWLASCLEVRAGPVVA
ncbi:hypothetical protein SDC9_152500 [bioreactor metagenome]|uniref:Uncharacterized protein n=1 Tax=bioreactor metagenome TaxID=1076179 RepID=A0A645EUW8_9ZZZZ